VRTTFERSLMDFRSLVTHYNACAKAKALVEATGGHLTKDEQDYLDEVYWEVCNHCQNPNGMHARPLADTLKHYKQ
jgi:hypothetical protein